MKEELPLDADELMLMAERIDALPTAEAGWVKRLFDECVRARVREAELLSAPPSGATEWEGQLAQVALDAAEWLKTLWNVGYMGAGSFPAQPRTAFPVIGLEDVLKSSLFARIREGKRPLPFPPPTRNGLPWHDLVEGDSESHVVLAELLRDEQGKTIGAVIEGCNGWGIVGEVVAGSEYIVQHGGKGPLFRLGINDFLCTLVRQAPMWGRQIRYSERAGMGGYTLIWPSESGVATQEIPRRAATWERAESEAAYWIASNHPAMYGQVRFERA